MGWKQRKPLWPFVVALTILLVLAVEAPRKWQPGSERLASATAERLPGPDTWYQSLTPPREFSALPEISPVETLRQPSLEQQQDEFGIEAIQQIVIPSPVGLPSTDEFTLDTLLQIRDSLKDITGQLPASAECEPIKTPDSTDSQRVVVNSPADRLAMREPHPRFNLPSRTSAHDTEASPNNTNDRLEAFADELMASVKRSRQGLEPPVRVALRDRQPVAPEANLAVSAETESVEVSEHSHQVEPKVETRNLADIPNPCPGLMDHAEEFGWQLFDNLRIAAREARGWERSQSLDNAETFVAPDAAVEPRELQSERRPLPVTPVEDDPFETTAVALPAEEGSQASVEDEQVALRREAEELKAETLPILPLLRFCPEALIERLERVPADSPASAWSLQAVGLVKQLAEDTTTPAEQALPILVDLQRLVIAGRGRAEQVTDHALRQHWLRLTQALECRTIIWRHLFDPQLSNLSHVDQPSSDNGAEVLEVLQEIAALLNGDIQGDLWREYLMLDQIAAATSEGAGSQPRLRRKLAQKVLSRVDDPRLTEAQSDFVKSPRMSKLKQCLLPWALGPVDVETLAAIVERYDARPDSRYAAALTQFRQRLQWSPREEYRLLASHLDEHYRGANMRVAVSGDLMTRLLPQTKSSYDPVNDHIAGAKIKGRSRTTVNLETQMIPNANAWQMNLRAKGAVFSKTHSDTWPAKVNNAAKMFYDARKTIWIDGNGMRVSETKASVKGRNDLVGIDSDFDPIPILGRLVRDAARRKHQQTRGVALKQAKAKVARQAKERMDRDANRKLNELEDRFANNILTSLEKLALIAEPTEMYTTSRRAVMHMRLANSLQLAAGSLRPLAPSDSLASVQLHESVLNNAVAGLQLEGRRLTTLELHQFISTRLGRPNEQPPEGLPLKAKIEFAPFDAIRFRCCGDRLEMILNVREVSHCRDKISNFAVHVFFRPKVDGLDVRLVRDGTLQFEGRRLRFGQRAVLQGVFNKLMRKDQEVQLVKHDLSSDPRLQSLMITQLVIEDGWIGLALGPKLNGRTAWRTLPHAVR